MTRLEMAILGLKRHSAMILDSAGFPLWFIRWYCPAPKGWGTAVQELLDRANGAHEWPDD